MFLLDSISYPHDLRAVPQIQLPQVAAEIREFLIHSVSVSGGHFASNLGCVELTVALHYVFNTPHDRLVWDVGHQTYPHKILTGRKAELASIRKQGGLSGFPKREESPYDAFGVGHSSTSIGAALGMAMAAKQLGEQRSCVAIIGDGAMTAGQAFEALSHAGCAEADVLVILNDNDMSISPNVGGLNKYLVRLLSSRSYAKLRQTSQAVLSDLPAVHDWAGQVEEYMKGWANPSSTLFEEFGFNYIGPVDGHDVLALTDILRKVKELKGPQFLHVVTKKGQGYAPAEAEPIVYHGITPFDPKVGLKKSATSKPSYSSVFGDWLCDMAAADERLVGITPAMREGSGMVAFHQRYPERYVDVAIAEQHAVTLAAGMACDGLKPVVAIYSTFLQRGYDQLIHDVALQNLPVVFAIDRAGLVGADGPTHAGAFDLSFLRCIPNLTVMAPSDEAECRLLLNTAYQLNTPSAVRYPRGGGAGLPASNSLAGVPVGQGVVRRRGDGRIVLMAFGSLVAAALVAAETLNATVVDMRFVKPLDTALLIEMAQSHAALLTLEENVIQGGAGSACLEALIAANVTLPKIQLLGLPDAYIEHGDHGQLLADLGLDAAGIVASATGLLTN
jgi:1-deoxy-D-xylulose-5-phosphate synthase